MADYSAAHDEVAAHYLGIDVKSGHPLLYRNRGGVRFEEVSGKLGLQIPCLPMGSNFGDLDNDGFLDFYLGTGTPSYESIAPNLMFRNHRGMRFQDVSYSGGFAHLQKGHGVAFGDFDDDGDQDVFQQMGGAYPGDAFPSALYLNPGHGHAWVTLRLVGRASNRFGIGSRIKLVVAEPDGEREIHVTVGSGGSFGGSSLQQEIGLGSATNIVRLEVRWPTSKTTQVFEDVRVGQVYEITEGRPQLRRLEFAGPAEKRSDVLSYDDRHPETSR